MSQAEVLATIAAGVLLFLLYKAATEQPDLSMVAVDAEPGSVDAVPTEEQQQTPSIIESAAAALDPSTYGAFAPAPVGDEQANVSAFLDMIAAAEGTAGDPDGGYRTMFGHRLMDSYADHPRQLFEFTNSAGQRLKTSAAGRYQFLRATWDELRAKLGLHDFSPASQDAACVELIRQRGALADVRAGRLQTAIDKCAKTWASLPGAGYSQPERKLTFLYAAYSDAGGSISEA